MFVCARAAAAAVARCRHISPCVFRPHPWDLWACRGSAGCALLVGVYGPGRAGERVCEIAAWPCLPPCCVVISIISLPHRLPEPRLNRVRDRDNPCAHPFPASPRLPCRRASDARRQQAGRRGVARLSPSPSSPPGIPTELCRCRCNTAKKEGQKEGAVRQWRFAIRHP